MQANVLVVIQQKTKQQKIIQYRVNIMLCEKAWSQCVVSELRPHVCHLVNTLLFLSHDKRLEFYRGSA